MATIVPASDNSGMGVVLGIILAIVLALAAYFFIIRGDTGNNTNIELPDVNVSAPATGGGAGAGAGAAQ